MVLGLRTKSRRGPSVHVDYVVHVQEIKPWPPSSSLKSLRSVVLQWENGERNTGSTKPVVPLLGTGVDDGRIEFNESFKIPVTLSRDLPVKGGDVETYVKNCLEFNLYELRSNKNVKGQLLGTVIVDVAEYGVLKEAIVSSAPMNCKRSFRNTAQPLLFIKIEPFHKKNSRSSSMESLPKEVSLDKDRRESVSALMNGEYDEEEEIASFTDDDDGDIDDDGSQHSSLTVSSSALDATGSSPPQSEENVSEPAQSSIIKATSIPELPNKPEETRPGPHPVTATQEHVTRSSSHSSSVESSSEVLSPENEPSFTPIVTGETSKSNSGKLSVQSSSSSIDSEEDGATHNNNSISFDPKHMLQGVHEIIANGRSTGKEIAQPSMEERKTNDLEAKPLPPDACILVDDVQGSASYSDSHFKTVNVKGTLGQSTVEADKASKVNGTHVYSNEDQYEKEQIENGLQFEQKAHTTEVEDSCNSPPETSQSSVESVGDTTSSERSLEARNSSLSDIKLKHVKSVRSSLDFARSKRFASDNQLFVESVDNNSLEDTKICNSSIKQNGKKHAMGLSREEISRSDIKVKELEQRVEKLERELRESAALEVSLYSVVAEHGSSANKVHAPARRLSRLYFHTWKESRSRKATAARSAVSGLVLVAKACGNDVPRLTFWLSNLVVLRTIISLSVGGTPLPVSSGSHGETKGGRRGNSKVSSPLKWEQLSSKKNQNKYDFAEDVDEWGEPYTFTSALEKVEAWIFSRIIESVWWQTLTPYMQSTSEANEECNLRNSYGKKPSLSGQEQANFSVELWKKAFKDACERLCPVRAAGHECGCLPVLARLVMEQCVNRLDVAMFNAILRESADDIPTDPVSDPISDSSVLPITAGKSSFGAGAQLKNAIGNWSRWLADLFGIDDDDSYDVQNDFNEDDIPETSSKSFHLLNALSDFMMLPKDMLLSRSIRKEVCPTFGAPLIKRILHDFSPDEFCPDPIPEEVFEALNVEDPLDNEEESITNIPCNAAPVVYLPPSAALLATFIGEAGRESQLRRSGSVLRKAYTSDDELDELDSPLASITDSRATSMTSSKSSGIRAVVRYELLQEVWRGGD